MHLENRALAPAEDDESRSVGSSSSLGAVRFCGRYIHHFNGVAIAILSVVCCVLFIQLQAVTVRVASEQRQIDELKQ